MNQSIDVQKTRRRDNLQASNRPGRECSLDATDRGSSPTPGSPTGQPGWGGTVREGPC